MIKNAPNVGKQRVYAILSAGLVVFALLPFPFGCGMVFSIRDILRGHPQMAHGTRPKELLGFWVRVNPKESSVMRQAIFTLSNGTWGGYLGMTRSWWHYDYGKLYVDSVSLCGNCYSGVNTSEYQVKFLTQDRILISSLSPKSNQGIEGIYGRVTVNQTLKDKYQLPEKSGDNEVRYRAEVMVDIISAYEAKTSVLE